MEGLTRLINENRRKSLPKDEGLLVDIFLLNKRIYHTKYNDNDIIAKCYAYQKTLGWLYEN